MQKALITGASSGIGKELALIMARAGHDLVLVARSEVGLQAVQAEIAAQSKVGVTLQVADLAVAGSAAQLYQAVKDQGIEILINNAGVGLKGNFFDDDIAATTQMAQLNMISLMELSQLFGQDFIRNNSGRILNVASITAFFPGPKQPVYYATKAFVRSLSRTLAYNLRGTNVTVTALHPGITRTNFFAAAQAGAVRGGASAKSVAELGYKAMMSGKTEVTHGFSNKLLTHVFARLTPYSWQAPIVDKASDA